MRCNIEQAAPGQPTQMRGRPPALAGIGDAVAQQQGPEPTACALRHSRTAPSRERTRSRRLTIGSRACSLIFWRSARFLGV
jgi:hypothetical protein